MNFLELEKHASLKFNEFAKNENASKSMLAGLKKFIDEERAKGIEPKKAIALYESKIKQIEQ